MGTQNQANNQQSQEELLRQQQQYQLMMQQQMKNNMLQYCQQWISQLDKKTILESLAKYCGAGINCFGNPALSQQLSTKLLELLNNSDADNFIVNAQQALLFAVNTTNNLRSQLMYSGMGMNNMMGGNQFGMNMMGGMNPMMGNPMMNQFGMPGMGMNMMGGMNPMMNQFGGMNQFGYNAYNYQQPQPTNSEMTEEEKEANKIKIARQYIQQNIYNADPLIFLQCIYNQGKITLNIDNDKMLEYLIAQAISTSIWSLANTNNEMFGKAYYALQQIYMTDYYSKLNNNKNGNQQNQQFNQFGMNPMMGNPMMNQFGMPGMGMNMMGGMNPMMNQFSMAGMGQFNMGGLGMGPMMNQGMNMMNGMTGSMGMNMPGMNNGSVSNCMF